MVGDVVGPLSGDGLSIRCSSTEPIGALLWSVKKLNVWSR